MLLTFLFVFGADCGATFKKTGIMSVNTGSKNVELTSLKLLIRMF